MLVNVMFLVICSERYRMNQAEMDADEGNALVLVWHMLHDDMAR